MQELQIMDWFEGILFGLAFVGIIYCIPAISGKNHP